MKVICVRYAVFTIRDAMWPEGSWFYCRLLMRMENEQARAFSAEESVRVGWSARQLQRQINTVF